MELEESFHWKKQKVFRKNIESYMVEYTVQNAEHQSDKHHDGALNAIARIPQIANAKKIFSGQTRKVLQTAMS